VSMPKNPARVAAMADVMKKAQASQLTPELEQALGAEFAAIEAKYPERKATFADFMKHLLHALEIAGVDHVGIGADMDGGGGVVGMEDVTGYPKITAALLKAGYNRDDLGKIWGGNVLRVLRQAETYKASLASQAAPAK